MSERLVPYTEFDSKELALQFREAIASSRELLEQRNLMGPIIRYGNSLETGIEKVEKGQRETATGELGHFAIIGSSGDVIGAASLFPKLPLYRQRIPVPAGIARKVPLIGQKLPHAAPNIHAWTNGDMEVLADAYRNLVKLANQPRLSSLVIGKLGTPFPIEPFNTTWSLEPARSPHEIHEAIIAKSGLEKVKTARFDDGEDSNKVPPKGTLYAQIRSEWSSTSGKLKELRTGHHSFAAHMDAGDDEMMSRSPRD